GESTHRAAFGHGPCHDARSAARRGSTCQGPWYRPVHVGCRCGRAVSKGVGTLTISLLPTPSTAVAMPTFIQRYLDPDDRLGEILFGLIMALGFTGAVRL